MPRQVTINMVAERAGVSRGTVDRVLNGRPHVKPEIYARVVRAMKELGYIPMREAQARSLGLTRAVPNACTLGVLLPGWHGYFRDEVMRGIADARALLENYQVNVIIEECRTELPEESVERLDKLAARGVQGIALCAQDHSAVVDKVRALHAQGIPVITLNSDLTDSPRLCFIGQDMIRSGRVAGDLMAKLLQPEDALLIAIGNPEFNGHRLRLQGFCARIYELGLRVGHLETIETYNDYALTCQKVMQALAEHENIKGIYMANHSVSGCVEAIRTVRPHGGVHVISHDLTDDTKRLLKSGEIDFAIVQDIYRQGYQPLVLLREYIQQQIVPQPENGRSTIEIICTENLN